MLRTCALGLLALACGSDPASSSSNPKPDSSTPKVVYPYGTVYQPMEHVLELTAAHVTEVDTALTGLGPVAPASPVPHDDFVIDPQ